MRRDSGPPGDDNGRSSPRPADAEEAVSKPLITYSRKPNTPARQCGRYASGWREGFTAGAVDALRRARRWVPADPDLWAVLEDLADAYLLVSGDD